MLEIDLELAGCRLLDDGVDRQVLRVRGVTDVLEQGAVFGKVVEAVHALAVRTGGCADRRQHSVVPVGAGLQQVELEFKRDDGIEVASGEGLGDAGKRVSAIETQRFVFRREAAQQHLRGRPAGPWHPRQRARHRPEISVAIARFDVQAGFRDLAPPDVEPVDRHRKVHAFLEGLLQAVGRGPLAAHDTVRIDKQELHGLQVRIGGHEGFVFFDVRQFVERCKVGRMGERQFRTGCC